MKDLAKTEHYDENYRVVNLHLEGRNPTQIAKSLGIKRVDVLSHIEEWKEIARNDNVLRERTREVVHEFDAQQSRVIAEMWDTIRDAENTGDNKTRGSILKALADVQAKRVETLQRAGLINDSAVGDEMARMEEKQRILVDILRKHLCPECKRNIAHLLTQVTGEVDTIVVEKSST